MTRQILVVDDEPGLQDMLAITLKKEGYEPVPAFSADEALTILEESRPSLIIIDIMMPGKSGIELCQEIRADEAIAKIPIIMLTARADTETMGQGYDAGADLYLTKPIIKDELLTFISRLLSA